MNYIESERNRRKATHAAIVDENLRIANNLLVETQGRFGESLSNEKRDLFQNLLTLLSQLQRTK